jgi:hypothetical protein
MGCSLPCETCNGTSTTCTSCKDGDYLDLVENTCLDCIPPCDIQPLMVIED